MWVKQRGDLTLYFKSMKTYSVKEHVDKLMANSVTGAGTTIEGEIHVSLEKAEVEVMSVLNLE